MKRYSIMVRQTGGGDHEYEHCQVASNPGPIVEALRAKTVTRAKTPAYYSVRVVDNEASKDTV